MALTQYVVTQAGKLDIGFEAKPLLSLTGLPQMFNNASTHCQKCHYFMAWKTPGYLVSRSEF